MNYQYNDGGRSTSTLDHKHKSDCVTRAIAIAAELPYDTVYEMMRVGSAEERRVKGKCKSHPGNGNGVHTNRKWFKDMMTRLGFVFVPTMGIGTGCKVHLREGDLPAGRLVVSLSKHYAAVVDGVLQDMSDCSRGGTRCVYGFWHKPKMFPTVSATRRIRL